MMGNSIKEQVGIYGLDRNAPKDPYMMPQTPQPDVGQQRTPSHQAPIRSSPPSSGFRVPLNGTCAWPPWELTGEPPIMNGDWPIYFGSAIFDKSVHPGKVEPKCQSPPCSVVLDGDILYHSGRYDLLPFDPDTMELVCTSEGRIPAGRRPVKGGYEADGMPLYHGIVTHQDHDTKHRIPGETSPHLHGCVYTFYGVRLATNHEILCWK
ncbi:hypothetical protein EDD18DRAFT_1196247 [Armillaria luteobubalina]|uniref:Uncharacterized protein n=1 Tax=Armillaria luteobubalina TaxID=153913 RepID=A0AA39PJK6_9AGAR|nr:hypothetical protein EDD18DRAFT_1196247 [Armillaria luteobubalina]